MWTIRGTFSVHKSITIESFLARNGRLRPDPPLGESAMKRKLSGIVLSMLLLAFCLPADAEVSKEWKKWAEGPVSYLMTDGEKAEWKRVSTDAEAERFEALFWARRDPTPSTPENEHRTAFEGRVAFADENFPEGNVRGAMTDRGSAIILLGVPTKMSRSQPRSTIQSGAAGSVDNARGQQLPSQRFVYERKSMAPWMGGVEFEVEFVDYYGHNQFKMTQNPRRDLKPLMEKAVEAFIVSPDLQEIPTYGGSTAVVTAPSVSTSLGDSRVRQAWESFRGSDAIGPEDLHLRTNASVTPEGESFLAVQVWVSPDATVASNQPLTLFGVVENKTEGVVAAIEEPVSLSSSKGDLYIDRSIPLGPGTYQVIFGLAPAAGDVVMKKSEVIIPPSNDETGVSELILSNDIHPLDALPPVMTPYTFGGMKVVPRGDLEFSTADEIWYVIEVRHPETNETGLPNLQIKLEVAGETGEGKPVKMGAPTMPAPASEVQGKPGYYMIGSSFPAGAFPAGSYVLKVRLLDALAKKSWNLESPFTVVAAASGTAAAGN